MPELPEVETVACSLKPKLQGKLCLSLSYFDPKLQKAPKTLKNYRVKDVSRFGKEILLHFTPLKPKNEDLFLSVHLRMSGRLLLNSTNQSSIDSQTEDYLKYNVIRIKSENFSKHVRATFHFNQFQLYFFDVRRFGTFKWYLKKPSLPLGAIDPIQHNFTLEVFTSILDRSKKQNLKSFLLRQDRIIGIGNIYASEILFKARLLPFRSCDSLSKKEKATFYKSIIQVLSLAIKHKGTTFSDFQIDDASTGSYQKRLKVYGQEAKSCSVCKHPIKREIQGQRSTFFCPICQK